MQPGSDHQNETLEDNWFEQQRAAIEASRQRADEALDLFRQATEALPKLDVMLREQESRARKLQARLESEGARVLGSLREAGAEQTRALVEKCKTLAEDARQSVEETGLRLEAALDSLLRRLDSMEAAVGQDRMAMNKLNQRLSRQTGLVEELTRRLAALEEEHRARLTKVSEDLLLLRKEAATIRGATVQLQGQVSRLMRFLSWFTGGGWWRRSFESPPAD